MLFDLKDKITNFVPIKYFFQILKKAKPYWLKGMSLYDLLKLFVLSIIDGAFTYHASAVAFSFFMALFPFTLFTLNLVPFIPLENFQVDFLEFVKDNVPPHTYDAIYKIINDILNNSHSGLLSSGFILSIFLMANGVSGIISGFESSKHIIIKRGFLQQYFVSLIISIVLAFLLLLTVAAIVIFEIIIQQTIIKDVLQDEIYFIEIGRYAFVILMILITTSVLLRYGTRQLHKPSFISIGSLFTTILVIISSYFFGIWVIEFSKYNELYGSIGTLLILMFYIWINCMILLIGFELNAIISNLTHHNSSKL